MRTGGVSGGSIDGGCLVRLYKISSINSVSHTDARSQDFNIQYSIYNNQEGYELDMHP